MQGFGFGEGGGGGRGIVGRGVNIHLKRLIRKEKKNITINNHQTVKS